MKLLGNRVLVARIEKEKAEGFATVDVQDDFIYRGKVVGLGQESAHTAFPAIGDTVLFAKYSPDTHDVKIGEETFKSVALTDILVIE